MRRERERDRERRNLIKLKPYWICECETEKMGHFKHFQAAFGMKEKKNDFAWIENWA